MSLVRPLVRLQQVDKIYANGTVALQQLNLDIPPDAFITLLGPSGCGKSTALRLIAGIGEISAGNIDWPSSYYDAYSNPLRELGFVFQEPTLQPWASVFDNVYLPLKLKGVSRKEAEATVMEMLDMVGLTRFADVYPRELSGGMKMRVSIARALVTRPRLLLMDEPFAALDEITRARLNDDLLAIWKRTRCTVVFVTHSIYESVYLSSRIVVFAARPGRIIGEVEVSAPYPRDEAFRLTPAYAELCGKVSALLNAASHGSVREGELS